MPEANQFEKIRKVKAKNVARLMTLTNVVGVGIGAKLKAGTPTGEAALRIYVSTKVPAEQLDKESRIPATLEGVATDVVQVGEPIAYMYTARNRPAIGGDSIGHVSVTAGTLGCLMRDKTDGNVVILSNNHVFANADAVSHARAAAGDCVVQPGTLDGGTCAHDQIATLKRWIKLVEVGAGLNAVDAALAQPLVAGDVQNTIHDIGCVSQWRRVTEADVVLNAADPDNVQKSGRTTEYTTGKIIDVDATVTINYGPFRATHAEVIVTNNMAAPGDSGSLLVDMNSKAVGLLFGGSPGAVVYYSKIEAVLDALNIEFLPCGGSVCVIGPASFCVVGGPREQVYCLPGGPWDGPHCIPGGPDRPSCRIGGPFQCLIGGPGRPCKPTGPLQCVMGGPGDPIHCRVGGPDRYEWFCKSGPKLGCLAGPPLFDDPRVRIVDPGDLVKGSLMIDLERLTSVQREAVAKLSEKLLK